MAEPLTAVTYHYVHDLESARFANLKALDARKFDEQLRYLAENHRFVTAADIAAALAGERPLPDRACALTFDDGFRDHYEVVFPRLNELGIQGMFYAPKQVLEGKRLLRVHKIQLLLAALDAPELLARTRSSLAARDLDVEAEARKRYVHESRFDDPETGYVKWLLGSFLLLPRSEQIVGDVFAGAFDDEAAVARKLYMTVDEAREMATAGMHFGGHGSRHYRLNEVDADVEADEIEASLETIGWIHGADEPRTFAYPYGTFKDRTVDRVRARGFAFAWGTHTGARIGEPEARFRIRRIDTNDLPRPVS